MKRRYLLLIGLLIMFLGIPNVFAAGATIGVKSSSSRVIVGSTTKVTVTVSSSDLGAWEYCISYDSSVLKLTKSTADANTCVKTGYVSSKSQKSSTETFTFKAIKSGTSKVTVKSYAVYSYENESAMSTSVSSVDIKTMTQAELESTYSTNANLKSLSVDNYALTPEFNKKTLEYRVEVPNEIESINLSAVKEDNTAEVSGAGAKTLTEGDNKFEIVVTAQKGNRKTYVVNVYRKELDPISVKLNGKEYFIVRKADALPQYPTFALTTIKYEENDIPALHSEVTDYTIVGLKDEDSNIGMYIYDGNEFIKYDEIKSDVLTIYPKDLPDDNKFSTFKVVDIDYNGYKMKGYQISDSSTFAIIYAQNIETGDVKYYSIDKKNGTIQEYNEEIIDHCNETMNIYKYIILGFIVLTIILLLIIIFKKTKKKVVVVNHPQQENNEVNILVEENKKKSKKEKRKTNKKQELENPNLVEINQEDTPKKTDTVELNNLLNDVEVAKNEDNQTKKANKNK